MIKRAMMSMAILGLTLVCAPALAEDEITVEAAPTDTGFNVGSEATIRAKLLEFGTADISRFAVFADISYMGTTAVSSAQLDFQSKEAMGRIQVATFEGGWLIPSEAPTGIYSVTLRVEDRGEHKVFARKKVRGFAAYKKEVRIARTTIDRTFYTVGQPIRCEVVLQNLSAQDLKGLRVEFSNANYPWISLFSEGGESKSDVQNPELAIQVLRDQLNIPPHSEVTIPMSPAGRAAFLQGQQVAVMGAGGPARNEKLPPPEVNSYTVAVWNADRSVLYDMQFTTPAVVRAADRDRPIPYGRNFTHAYNSDIDFSKYREFYPPGYLSPAIKVDRSRSLLRPGDDVVAQVTVKNTSDEAWIGAHVEARFRDATGKERGVSPKFMPSFDYAPGQTRGAIAVPWVVNHHEPPGVFTLTFSVVDSEGRVRATTTKEIAVNALPSSLMIFNAHEDDEGAYSGLIRAAVEARIPVRVVFFTGGDVGACERYYSKPCGPNEAREFAIVRMEESADALAHLGVPRENLTYLGLPDGGSGAIWSQHIKAAKPFRSIYLATDHAPYENVFKPNLAFARDSVIEVTKQLIADFRPAMIATTHPDERHVDHRTANWFVVKACQELLREQRIDPATIVLTDVSYGAGGFKPAPYRYDKAPVYLSGEAAALKQEMGWLYQSQDGNLHEGMRKPLAELPRVEEHLRIVDWQEHSGWNE